jgi:hypothetical protein
MSSISKSSAIMADDLYCRASMMVNRGNAEGASDVGDLAEFVIRLESPEEYYRDGLRIAGATLAAIDNAVVRVFDGEYPTDSLRGKVTRMLKRAQEEAGSSDGFVRARAKGEADALSRVLDILSAKL